jgi:hypothetical protein
MLNSNSVYVVVVVCLSESPSISITLLEFINYLIAQLG